MELVAVAYGLCGLLFLGGFACIVIGYRLVRARGRVATTPTEFTGKWGDREIHLGSGSLASLMVAVSAIWVGAGILVKPKLEYSNIAGNIGTRVIAATPADHKVQSIDKKKSDLQSELALNEASNHSVRAQATPGEHQDIRLLERRLQRMEENNAAQVAAMSKNSNAISKAIARIDETEERWTNSAKRIANILNGSLNTDAINSIEGKDLATNAAYTSSIESNLKTDLAVGVSDDRAALAAASASASVSASAWDSAAAAAAAPDVSWDTAVPDVATPAAADVAASASASSNQPDEIVPDYEEQPQSSSNDR
ncbi:hypothetical protein ABU614_19770 [Lysobacter firmicutimachus]|uniref:Uncharacterized protein n=1 Tax=Lysobacter firmicutimachus TaxID=1792846 RepID=A0AAU8MSJ6_9GAMM